ncbi:response regulator [Pseudanabaena biceps]|nr:response regulator [Pseudanabaena biceps]
MSSSVIVIIYNIGLQCHISKANPKTVIGDRNRLRQILLNLVGNAIKFTNQGSVVISYSHHLLSQNLYEFRFVIADTGIGIDGENIHKLFNPFTQADSSINRLFGGTGLGLAICKRLVELMNGTIWVESGGQVGGNPPRDWEIEQSRYSSQGSVFYFTITLPQLDIAKPFTTNGYISAGDISTQLGIHADQFPIKILIVEDNILNQKIASLMLKRLGYEADIVASGQECIEALTSQSDQSSYDLVFMDIQMPIMNGLDATIAIRRNLTIVQPWIVALTADAMPEDQVTCMQVGMNDYMSKPVDLNAIARSLIEFVNRKV